MMMRLMMWSLLAGLLASGVALMAGETCFYKGETTDGLNKICFYSCLSGDAAITIKSHQLCPLSIKR